MADFLIFINGLFAVLQTLALVALAPLFVGWVRRMRCLLQNRSPAGWLQPYNDLRKLFAKEVLLADTATHLFRLTPYVVFAATVMAASVVPFVALDLPTAQTADAIALVGFFALARVFLALAGLDVGTAFGGMGSSRDMTIGALAEPAMLMVIFTLAMVASSTNLSTVIGVLLDQGLVLRPSLLFSLLALLLVAVAECGRIPVDNPTTHLELTMVHEAMILEYSGRQLALIEWAAQLKLTVYAVLIANLFMPWGIAVDLHPGHLLVGVLAILAKLALLGAVLAIAESVVAKMRLFRVPAFLSLALILALIGMLSHNILERA